MFQAILLTIITNNHFIFDTPPELRRVCDFVFLNVKFNSQSSFERFFVFALSL